jgi:hypothetical protein
MPNPPTANNPDFTTSKALRQLINPNQGMSAGQIVKATGAYQKSAQFSEAEKKLIGQRTAPVRSALVRQKVHAVKDIGAVKQRAKALKGVAKSNLAKEMGSLKKAALPYKQLAKKDEAALKQHLKMQKQAALKAVAPTRSALVRQKVHADKNLLAYKNQLKTMEGTAKSQVKKAALPYKQLAKKDEALLKQEAQLRKQALLKATTPVKSVLVRQKQLATKDLSLVKGQLGKDVTSLKSTAKKDLGAAKSAAQQTEAGQMAAKSAKKAKAFGKAAAKTPLGRLFGL